MGELLYFILMPPVYAIITLLIYHFGGYYEGSFSDKPKPKWYKWVCCICQMIIYYLIELVYILSMNSILEQPLFTERTKGVNWLFILLASVFIIIHLVVLLGANLEYTEYRTPFVHILVLLFLFAIFMLINCIVTQETVDKSRFDAMEYEIAEQKEITLKGFTYKSGVQGEVSGSWWYVYGSVSDTKKINYSYIDAKGETVLDDFVYNNDTVDIFEDDKYTIPKLIITTYTKTYESYSHTYVTYLVQIPKNTFVSEFSLH